MKNTGLISLIVSAVLTLYLAVEKFGHTYAKKIGVVQMDKLVYDYKGMKEATSKYEKKMAEWSGQADSLQHQLERVYGEIKADSIRKDKPAFDRDLKTFLTYRETYNQLIKKTRESAQNEDRELTVGVINQINECIKEYAEKEGYDMVLCNSQQQSVGHANEQIDITEKVLAFANRNYEGHR